MKILRPAIISAMVFALSLGTGVAFAQTTPSPAPYAASPAQDTMKPAKPAKKHVHKTSYSKSCMAQGHAKKLHGKALSRFEANCKHHSGA